MKWISKSSQETLKSHVYMSLFIFIENKPISVLKVVYKTWKYKGSKIHSLKNMKNKQISLPTRKQIGK